MNDLAEQYILQAIQNTAQQRDVTLPRFAEDVAVIERVMGSLELLHRHPHEQPLGLSLAAQVPLSILGGVGLAMRASKDLGAALNRLARFHQVRTPFVELSLVKRDDGAIVQLEYHLPKRPCLAVIVEGGLAMLVNLGRKVCGVDWSPSRVVFPHAVCHQQVWEDFFQAPVQAGLTAQFTLSHEVLALPTEAPDTVVSSYLDAMSEDLLESQAKPLLTVKIQRWLTGRLEHAPTAHEAAKAMGMSRRTLHRQLEKAGVCFQNLLDDARKQEARTLLEQGASVGEVALALGYSDTSSFCRAYRRWTGKSPGRAKR